MSLFPKKVEYPFKMYMFSVIGNRDYCIRVLKLRNLILNAFT